MYTEPIIVNADRLNCRCYITFQLDGVRQRVASGRILGLRIFPNRAKTVELRREGLEALRVAIVKSLAADTFPLQPEPVGDADVRLIVSVLHRLTVETRRTNELHDLRILKLQHIQDLLTEYLKR